MLESFVLYIARDRAAKYGKEYLLRPDGILEIFVEACNQIYTVQGKDVKKPEEYISWLLNDPVFHEIGPEIIFLHNNLGVKQFDTKYDLQEKKQIIINSISRFENLFQNLKENYDYQKFEDDEGNQKKTASYILENLKTKIEDTNELRHILKSLESIDMNYIINYKGDNIYPLITDMLIDIVFAEYMWFVDKDLIKAIITEWSNAEIAQEKRDFFGFAQYTKMELIEKVKYNRLRQYFLSEYARQLQIDKKKLRTFMQHILYYDVKNHKNTPDLSFDIIEKIPQRPFFLERTKMVIGGI